MAEVVPRPETVGPDDGPAPPFPLRVSGKVIKGFGRGSSELGIPTANIPTEGLTVGGQADIESGVYFGWAGLSPSAATKDAGETIWYDLMQPDLYSNLRQRIRGQRLSSSSYPSTRAGSKAHKDEGEHRDQVFPMVMSIGWNPFYKNTVRSVEVHIMHQFKEQFYDSHMNLIILGFIRPELNYVSKEKLIEDIKTDIDVAGRSLDRGEYVKYATDPELVRFEGKSEVAH